MSSEAHSLTPERSEHDEKDKTAASAIAAQPRVASSGPIRIHIVSEGEVAAACTCGRQHVSFGDTKEYCTCGRSTSQPWCDGQSHVGTPFLPHTVVITQQQKFLLLCACKRTKDPNGFCDGSHIHLTAADMEW